MLSKPHNKHLLGFTLVEVVIVVAIIAVLAAIAIPRLSRGTSGAADSALEQSLSVLRRAIDHYAVEHNGEYPKVAKITNQLTRYTNEQGQARLNPDATHIYGPYLRSIPPLPVGERVGNTGISDTDANDVGWIYRMNTGHIRANTSNSERSESGVRYRDF